MKLLESKSPTQQPERCKSGCPYDRIAPLVLDGETSDLEKVIGKKPTTTLLPPCCFNSLVTAVMTVDKQKMLHFLMRREILTMASSDALGQGIMHWSVALEAPRCTKLLMDLCKDKVVEAVLSRDKNGVTPLHIAAKQQSARMLKLLLSELTATRNLFEKATDAFLRSPLHYAAAQGSLECCEEILSDHWGLPVDQKDKFGQTPLMYAAGNECAADVARLLAQKKMASVKARNKRGMAALHIAVMANNIPVLRVLVSELKCSVEVFDNESRTPLHYAALYARLDAIKLLLEAGARNESRDQFHATPAHYAAQRSADALFAILRSYASSQGNVTDSQGRSCFMWAVVAQNEAVVRRMLDPKCPLSVPRHGNDARDNFGYTALHLAAQLGDDKDKNGAMPIHLAAGEGRDDAVRSLVNAGCTIRERDDQNRTALDYACFGGKAHTVRNLLTCMQAGQLKEDLDRALHCAAFAGSVYCVDQLLEFGANVSWQDEYGLMPLHVAADKGHFVVVERLVARGADVNARAADPKVTPLALARSSGHEKVARFLQSKGAR
ncbi:CBN-MLT-4 protein [Aphelenchoides avenae]|nr:CBN-MLT-4 protein [Aphelenchus avenae]